MNSHAPRILDGKAVAAAVLEECRAAAAPLMARGVTPGLAVVIVGDDPASQVYVGSKVRTCTELGWHSLKIALPASASQAEVLEVVAALNTDPAVHGILVQSPPPPHIDEHAIVRAIAPRKDVDGFHPENVAKLALEDPTGFVPCTPAGCMRLLEAAGVATAGAEAVVLLMAKSANATVTVAHSRSRDLPALCRRADILVAAVGRPEMVRGDWVKPGAVVIDVGINRVPDPSRKSGHRLTGDVAFAEVAPHCAAITPVPGGVGPMT
ncbi:MAG: bifunctional 5,10-methylene-tetrahydrofolate dehydrogenase/5,10-methylene-tetrahydrofolate cyclohydrolase, partial [Akkermansiaceae bacterium]|nr:bifunctional 5,10-methylene-tetrahydrofolate dehydrogenase/5,10-methylene-tetrahydrofolate cyclohydrolase [Akkermansiaceae bacterium]